MLYIIHNCRYSKEDKRQSNKRLTFLSFEACGINDSGYQHMTINFQGTPFGSGYSEQCMTRSPIFWGSQFYAANVAYIRTPRKSFHHIVWQIPWRIGIQWGNKPYYIIEIYPRTCLILVRSIADYNSFWIVVKTAYFRNRAYREREDMITSVIFKRPRYDVVHLIHGRQEPNECFIPLPKNIFNYWRTEIV